MATQASCYIRYILEQLAAVVPSTVAVVGTVVIVGLGTITIFEIKGLEPVVTMVCFLGGILLLIALVMLAARYMKSNNKSDSSKSH